MTICLCENGIGVDAPLAFPENVNSGFGLYSIKERIKLFGGDFTLESEKNKGTKIIITMPVKEIEDK